MKNLKRNLARLGTVITALLIIASVFLSNKTKAMMKPGETVYSANEVGNLVSIKSNGDYYTSDNRYAAKFIVKLLNQNISSVTLQILTFYCPYTTSNGVCSDRRYARGWFKTIEKREFNNNIYQDVFTVSPINNQRCGSFQIDVRVSSVKMNDEKTIYDTNKTEAEGGLKPGLLEKQGDRKTWNPNRFVWAVCNRRKVNGTEPQNCGLPSDWQANCTQPTPTPNPTNTPTPTPTNSPTNTPTPTPTPHSNPTNTPTPTPQPSRQTINQTVNVNQNVNIQNSANNNQQVLGASTQSTPKQMPKTGAPSLAFLSSILIGGAGIIIKRKLS